MRALFVVRIEVCCVVCNLSILNTYALMKQKEVCEVTTFYWHGCMVHCFVSSG
jgi:hypothetical protein